MRVMSQDTENDRAAAVVFDESSNAGTPRFGSPEFRAQFRSAHSTGIGGTTYALLVLIYLLGMIVTLIVVIPRFTVYDAVALPFYFLFVNLLEYLLHRFPMHRKMRMMGVVFEHVTIHHNFYANDTFFFEEPRDYFAAILPAYLLFGLSVVIAVVSGLVYWLTGEPSHAIFFALVAFSYYLLYELLHFSYHAAKSSFLKRIPLVHRLARLHIAHHRTELMGAWNFNITFPIYDVVFGTLYRPADPIADPQQSKAALHDA